MLEIWVGAMCTRMNEWKIPLLAVGPRYTPYPINLDLEILEKDRKKTFLES